MWLDNASNIDMLFYSPYANTIVNFTKNEELTPLTIGLYGSWGAGKSSLLQMIQSEIDSEDDGIVCVSLNAWQFEGYEDAKVALMETLLKSIEENKRFFEKVGDKIKKLIQRVDFLKMGKDLVSKGVPYAVSALTGNPIPIAISLSSSFSNIQDISSGIKEIKDNYFKTENSEAHSDNIRKFRTEFEDMLNAADSVKNLVVIVDDLDRCTPERIIDTLEAIKLFLSVKKTTFIIAVDERIIKYAVDIKYPKSDSTTLSADYIEKIIQLPIKIPELSPKDIQNYLTLLICQLHLKPEVFKRLIESIYESSKMLDDSPINLVDIKSALKLTKDVFKNGATIVEMERDVTIIEKIGGAISPVLKGNPRQAKRFLNTFFVRKNLATLYFKDELDLPIMAKLLALEFIDIRAFRELNTWQKEFNGTIPNLDDIEKTILGGGTISDRTNWENPRIRAWVNSEPLQLHTIDLSKYFYLSREALISAENITASFTETERNILSSIKNCIQGQEELRFEELSRQSTDSQNRILDALLTHFDKDELKMHIVRRIFLDYEPMQTAIVDLMKKKDKSFYTIGVIPHMRAMYERNSALIESLLGYLLREGKIDAKMKSEVSNRGNRRS